MDPTESEISLGFHYISAGADAITIRLFIYVESILNWAQTQTIMAARRFMGRRLRLSW
jgi:hypothetical protein